MVQLRPNRVKDKIHNGETAIVVGGYQTPDIIDFMGPMGFDGIWLEGEHGGVDYGDIGDLTRACDLWGLTSIARVNLNLPGVIYRTLDVGAQGICVPHVNTGEEARAVVDAGKFAPLGHRGMFASRQGIGIDNFIEVANEQSLLTILIEDIVAIDNMDEILEVDNIDCFFVATGDLAQSMGHPGNVEHPDVLEVAKKANRKIVDAGRVAGATVREGNLEACIDMGCQLLLAQWTSWVTSGGRAFLERVAATQ